MSHNLPAMLRRGKESYTVNNYISGARENCFNDNSITHLCPGAVGGAGGAGSAQGQGGGGGTGEGPELSYAFDAIENLTMNNLNLYVERVSCILSDMHTEDL
jgi:hypothetical protein